MALAPTPTPTPWQIWAATSGCLAAFAASSAIFPSASLPALAAGLGVTALAARLDRRLPSRVLKRLRQSAKIPDRPVALLGSDPETGGDIWIGEGYADRVFHFVGPHGSGGRVDAMTDVIAGHLAAGSGALVIDGVGGVDRYTLLSDMCRSLGRDDDLLVLNFTGSGSAADTALTHTFNPFARADADAITQMIVSMMDPLGVDGAMWRGRATAMLTGIMRALCHLRDKGLLEIKPDTIRDRLSLRRVIDLADNDELSDQIRHTIKSYLTSLPGFQPEKGYKQAPTTLDQHGYLEMQFTKLFGFIADVWGHVFDTASPEVDMRDIVRNRRILVVLLPSLKKSADEVANLGKIVLAAFRSALGADGWSRADLGQRGGSHSPPFACVFDDADYYAVDGIDRLSENAERLNLTLLFGTSRCLAEIRDFYLPSALKRATTIEIPLDGSLVGADGFFLPPRNDWPRQGHYRKSVLVSMPVPPGPAVQATRLAAADGGLELAR